jgi:dihydrofolate synthase / folylpolyglutamate synthase
MTTTVNINTLLKEYERFGIHLGLESIQRLLHNLGNPHRKVPIIHVAGSNGKGSVCAYLSAVLTQAGYRVGRYISPHLVSWCERICLNDRPISPDALQQVLLEVQAAIHPDDPSPTQFEVITAAAWLYFAQQKVDIAVMEVGLGGRLDATNVVDAPLVSIITSISREHWQRLGPTIADIAGEKAGILKPECPAVIGQLPPEAASVIHRRIRELSCPAIYPQPAKDLGNGWAEYRGIEEHVIELDATELEDLGLTEDIEATAQVEIIIRYRLPLQGEIQLLNSALAIAALQILRQDGWRISDDAIAQGIEKTRWQGRLQWLKWRDRPLLIDGAHNPASAAVLRQYVDSLNGKDEGEGRQDEMTFPSTLPLSHSSTLPPLHSSTPTHWVMGMLSTKDHADVFEALLRKGDRLYLVPVPDHSSADPQTLATLAHEVCPELSFCQTYPDVISALEAAMAAASNQLVVLCGSLYLIGHFLQLSGLATEDSA